MIVILNKADFSDISIGTINVPVEISEWTKNVISKFPSFNWNSYNRQALEHFHISLTNNELLDKIEYLAMPIFASSLEESMQNILGGNEKVNIPSNASSKYNVVLGKGIARNGFVSGKEDVITVGLPNRSGVFSLDCHFMAYPTENIIENSAYKATTQLDNNPDITTWNFASYMQTWGFGYGIYSLVVGGILNTNRTDINTRFWLSETEAIDADANFAKLSEPAIASSYNKVISLSQAEQNFISKTATNGIYFDGTNLSEDTKLYVGLSPIIANDKWFARHFGFLGYGKHLSNGQSIAYQKALKKLVAMIEL